MKLFKKLAAAVLVAALTLMMVGCGSKTGLAQQIKDAGAAAGIEVVGTAAAYRDCVVFRESA